MSDVAGRYQNALRYNPGLSAGVYLDPSAVPDWGIQQVASRAPVHFDPFMGQVAQFGQAGALSDGSDARGPNPGTDYLALAARYGPQAFKAAQLPQPKVQGGRVVKARQAQRRQLCDRQTRQHCGV